MYVILWLILSYAIYVRRLCMRGENNKLFKFVN